VRATLVTTLVLAAGLLMACGQDGETEELGQMSCQEVTDEWAGALANFEPPLDETAMVRYLAARLGAPASSLEEPDGGNRGWAQWFLYFCDDDPEQTAEEAYGRASEVVDEEGGAAEALDYYEAVQRSEEDPPE